MFFGKQKFDVKQLKLNKFIFDVKQLKINKFTFDVKQLKMNRFIKSISDLIISTSNATLEVPLLCPCSDYCGIFAFACVRFIVTRKKTKFNAKLIILKIRAYFLQCLAENDKLTKLSQWEYPIRRCLPKIVTVMLFCSFV